MAVDEIRIRLRRKLTEAFDEEEAEVLLDQSTDLKLEAMEHRLRAEFADVRSEIATTTGALRSEIATTTGALRSEIATLAGELRGELRDQTWRLTGALLVAMGLVAAIVRVG